MTDQGRRPDLGHPRRWAERRYLRHRRHNRVYAQPGIHQVVLILDNLKASFNIGKIFRSGDAFGVRGVHLVGIDYFETKPAKGCFKHVPAIFHETFEECHASLAAAGYTLFILDPDGEDGLHKTPLPRRSGFIFGHEEYGVSFQWSAYPEIRRLRISQVGRVDSLNVAVAASVTMYEYFRQHHPGN